MGKAADQFFQEAIRVQREARENNREVLQLLGPLIGDNLIAGGVLHTFGSGHSEILSRELLGRAGGLVCITGMVDPTEGRIEHLPGYGTHLLETHARLHGMKTGETVIVISNSGKNPAPLEVAAGAKALGLIVVALTSLAMSRQASSSLPDGKRLFEIADHVLDNRGVPGDAIVELPPPHPRAGSTSTLTGAILLNLLQMEIIDHLLSRGHPPPLLKSQNLPGNRESNLQTARPYQHRLSRPL